MSTEKNNRFDVEKIASLAKLRVSPETAARLQSDVEAIVGYVEMLSELNTDGVDPTTRPGKRVNVLRDDIAEELFSRETMLKNAPEVTDNGEFVKVPQVLPGE